MNNWLSCKDPDSLLFHQCFPKKWRGICRVPWRKAPMTLLNNLQPLNTCKSPSPAIRVSWELHVTHTQLLVRKVRQISAIKPCRNAKAKENQACAFPRLQQRPFCLLIVLKMWIPVMYLSKGSPIPLLQHKILRLFMLYLHRANTFLYIISMVIPYSLLFPVPELWHSLLNFTNKIIFISCSHSAWKAFLENILRNCSPYLHHSFLKILPAVTSAKKLLCLLIGNFYCFYG